MAATRQCLWLALFVLVALSALEVASASRSAPRHLPMSVRHERWMAQHGRVYKDAAEKERRFRIFKANAEYVEAANRAGNLTYKLGLTQFADRTAEEFKLPPLGVAPRPPANTSTFSTAVSLDAAPDSVDWVTQGAVTPIKNQGTCGCCWAFSAVAAVEGITQIKTGELMSLSEQEVLDCIDNGYTCRSGGWMSNAFTFIVQNGGLATDSDYPYQGSQGTCNQNMASSPVATITGSVVLPSNDEASLQSAVAMQPVSVTIMSGSRDFQLYNGGIFSGECGAKVDHAVTVVGYGTANDGTKYWLLKNQWGKQWGEGGYMRLKRDVEAPEGWCGVAMNPTYPTA